MADDVLDFYCDSSSHRGHKYVVVAGVAGRPHRINEINAKLEVFKETISMKSEFKWSQYRGGRKEGIYFGVVDYFFELISNGQLHFHGLVCDFNRFDHHRAGRGNPETSVNKLYYQLMLHQVCKQYGNRCRIQMFPDHENDSAQVTQFREAICARAYRQYATRPNCLRAIHPIPSSNHNVLQMLDIVIGSIAALREDRQLSGHKMKLANYILEKSPVSSWDQDVTFENNSMSLWNFRL
jgi:hypothetical protein